MVPLHFNGMEQHYLFSDTPSNHDSIPLLPHQFHILTSSTILGIKNIENIQEPKMNILLEAAEIGVTLCKPYKELQQVKLEDWLTSLDCFNHKHLKCARRATKRT